MTAAAFDRAVADHPNMAAHTRVAARAVLVDGQAIKATGEKHGIKKQRLHEIVSQLHPDELPPGWTRRLVSLPAADMAMVLKMQDLAYRALRTKDGTDK